MNDVMLRNVGLLALLVLLVFACEDDPCQDPSLPECENYDPCLDERVVDAEFEMSYLAYTWLNGEIWDFDFEQFGAEGLRLPWYAESEYDYLFETADTWIPSDTAVYRSSTYIHCEATHPDAQSYRWRVGAEGADREGQAISVLFGSTPPLQTLDIKLTVEGEAFAPCPSSDSIAQSIQTMTFIQEEESRLLGRWQGRSTQYPDEIRTLEFKKRPFFSDSVYVLTGLLEFSEDCGPAQDGGEHGFRFDPHEVYYLTARAEDSTPGTCGDTVNNNSPNSIAMRLAPDGTLHIVYSEFVRNDPLTNDDNERAYFRFEGRRAP